MTTRHIGSATLILGDSFQIMPTLGEVDVLITDPPYNPKTHKGARSAKSLAASPIDFDSLTEEKFIEFCANAVAQTRRWVVMSCAWQQAAQLEKAGVPLVRLGVWHKPNGAPQFTGDRPGMGWEAIAILLATEGSAGMAADTMPCGCAMSSTASIRHKNRCCFYSIG